MELSSEVFDVSQSEGWCIAETGLQDAVHNLYELQKIDDMRVFQTDDEAIRFVVKKAIKEPTSIHAQAIRFLEKESPNEVHSIIMTAVSKREFDDLLKIL